MRINALCALTLVGCTTQHADEPVAKQAPDAAPAVDRCGGYYLAVAPFLGRLEQGADSVNAALVADDAAAVAVSARDLAALLDDERSSLATVFTGSMAIDAAHERLLASVDELAGVLDSFAAVLPDGSAEDK